ncbi:MAG: ABC transporter ATP-binding protein [Campylobacterota bacterium]|nr:ABC transporter ATP-binding protein [Campylobacterota bacterium]
MKDIKIVLRRLVFPYLKDYIPYLLLALVGMIISAAGASSSAYLVKPVLDEIFIEKNTELLQLLPLAIILVYAMKGGGKYMQVYFSAYIGHDIIRRIRNRMLDTMLSLDISFFHKFRSGELISRNINDIERIRTVVSTMIPEIGRQTLTALGLLGVVIYQSPKLSFFALIVIPVIIYPLYLISKRIKKLSHKSQEKTSDITSKLSEIFSNIEIIKAHAAEKFEHTKFKDDNQKFFELNIKTVKTTEITGPMMEILGAVGIASVIIVGGTEVIEGRMTVGSFFSFLTALFMLYTPLKRLSAIYNAMQDAIAASERIFFILDQKPLIVGAKKKVSKIEQIKFDDVRLSYGEKEALKGIDLTVKNGERIALVGDSGGGKSSIINLLVRFYDPSSGAIYFNDENINNFSLEELRTKIATVTQRVYIFNDTVASNVAYGKDIDKEKVMKCLEQAHALDFVESLENGIDTMLDEHGTNLSGGQRQRIAIARALYVDPEILIFDEATSALDSKSEQYITQAIEEISKDRITIIIAHRLSTIKTANKIAVLRHGKIICLDTEDNLLQNCDEYKKLSGEFSVEQ